MRRVNRRNTSLGCGFTILHGFRSVVFYPSGTRTFFALCPPSPDDGLTTSHGLCTRWWLLLPLHFTRGRIDGVVVGVKYETRVTTGEQWRPRPLQNLINNVILVFNSDVYTGYCLFLFHFIFFFWRRKQCSWYKLIFKRIANFTSRTNVLGKTVIVSWH